MDIHDRVIERDYFVKLFRRIARNEDIALFYDNLYEETRDELYGNLADRMRLCLKWWDVDYYQLQQIKDIRRVNLCRDKFCLNCQCQVASKRQDKYAPLLDSYRNDYMVVHMVVTIPNPVGVMLRPILDKMYSRFGHLVRYLRGNAKVKGIDFLQYGFVGGIRALEVTYNKEERTYHPHFHCMMLFRKDLKFNRKYINSFSYDKGKLVHKYSAFEILVQKVWYLLINGIKVTKDSIQNLKEGYDVYMADAEGYYHEAFKYACKGAFDEEEGAFIYDEEVFRTLRHALHGRRMIQGYGLLYNCNDEDGQLLQDEIDKFYEAQIARLQWLEKPVLKIESFNDILAEKNCKYMSKTNIGRFIRNERREQPQKQ